MKQRTAGFTALHVDFDIEVFKADKGVYVLAQDRPHQRGLLNFVSPPRSTKRAMQDYCKANFDDVLRSLYPGYAVEWSEQLERSAPLEIGQCPLQGAAMNPCCFVDPD